MKNEWNLWRFTCEHPFITLLLADTVAGIVKYAFYTASCMKLNVQTCPPGGSLKYATNDTSDSDDIDDDIDDSDE